MIVGFFSMKGGVGKSTLAINLSAYLRKFYGKKVILIDFNFYNYSSKVFSGENLLEYGDNLCEGIYPLKYFHIKFVKRFPSNLERDLGILKAYYDYIVMDVPNDLNLMLSLEKYVDLIFLVLTPEIFSIFSNLYLYRILEKNKVRILVNRVQNIDDIKMIEREFGRVSAIIHYNKDFLRSSYLKVPLPFMKKKGKALDEIDELASIITGERKRKSILEKIVSFFL
ncbi:MAG: hypothetical protein BXU00_00550 [Candidatus Nanoclepta minutus]|uniref:CobQ/CobB/MinD/ParA nucleotide binding domain-containing protein n=1 Tax=Candidatus Nanoclepta minutus TaxID=1940235 RepID=A0A397WNT5_9ARCH|nr:MAG: hypothetical protein BXU00_00550 [Candidatus Nanoclepta minutus]